MDFSLWIAFAGASTALLLIPGPTVLLVLAYAISQGRKIAIPTALGVATGDLVAMSLSLAGLGALVLASATLFTVLKWAGAVYLIYLGIRMFFSARDAEGGLPQATGHVSPRTAFLNAAMVTALNPKSIVFFIAFVPQFLDPSRALVGQSAVMIATFVTLAAVNALAYALMADRLRDTIRRPSIIRWLTRAGGGALIAMGAATASLRRAA